MNVTTTLQDAFAYNLLVENLSSDDILSLLLTLLFVPVNKQLQILIINEEAYYARHL